LFYIYSSKLYKKSKLNDQKFNNYQLYH